MKSYIKQKIPKSLMHIWYNYKFIKLNSFDRKKFMSNYSSEQFDKLNQQQIKSRMIFHAHAIEKGLSRDDLRYGFGKKALLSLHNAMTIYKSKNFNTNDKAWLNTLSVLKEYSEVHQNDKEDSLEYFNNLFAEFIKDIKNSNTSIGGVIEVTKESKLRNHGKNFEELSLNRFSIRNFNDEEVDIDKLKKVVGLSLKSPSVCNRQGANIHVMTNKEKILQTLEIQGGFNGYDAPPILLLITSDIQSFVSVEERNQVYIDGGLVSMSVMYALEFEGLAACPLNAMVNTKKENLVRKIFNISDNENLIMFMAVGNFKERVLVPKSFRYDVETKMVIH